MKSVSRSNLVIGGMTYTTGNISPQLWIENLRLPGGNPPRLDMYGHNPFSFRAPNLSNPPSPDQQIDFSDLGRLSKLVDRYLGRPGNPDPKLFISEWTVPTKIDLEFNFYVEPLLQAQWITDGLRIASSWSRIYAVGCDPPLRRTARHLRRPARNRRREEARLLRLEGWLSVRNLPRRRRHRRRAAAAQSIAIVSPAACRRAGPQTRLGGLLDYPSVNVRFAEG